MSAREQLVHQLQCQGPFTERAARELVDTHTDEVLLADGQDYPGQLAMLTGLVATLNAVAEHGDFEDVKKLLAEYASDDAQAREQSTTAKAGEKSSPAGADATPDFFQVGHTYAREHHASTIRFLVRHIDRSPDGSYYQVAFGWRTEDGDVLASPFDSDDFTGWTDVTEEVSR